MKARKARTLRAAMTVCLSKTEQTLLNKQKRCQTMQEFRWEQTSIDLIKHTALSPGDATQIAGAFLLLTCSWSTKVNMRGTRWGIRPEGEGVLWNLWSRKNRHVMRTVCFGVFFIIKYKTRPDKILAAFRNPESAGGETFIIQHYHKVVVTDILNSCTR